MFPVLMLTCFGLYWRRFKDKEAHLYQKATIGMPIIMFYLAVLSTTWKGLAARLHLLFEVYANTLLIVAIAVPVS